MFPRWGLGKRGVDEIAWLVNAMSHYLGKIQIIDFSINRYWFLSLLLRGCEKLELIFLSSEVLLARDPPPPK